MDYLSAIKELGLPETGFQKAKAQMAFDGRMEELRVQLDRAPTPAMKSKRQDQIQRLQEAWDFLSNMPGSGGSQPQLQPQHQSAGPRQMIYLDRYEAQKVLQSGAESDLIHGWDRERNEGVLLRVWKRALPAVAAADLRANVGKWSEILHPAIVGIRSFATDGDVAVLVMDAVSTDAQVLGQSPVPLDSEDWFGLSYKLAQAIEVLAMHGMEHGAICAELVLRQGDLFRILPPLGVDAEALRGFRMSAETGSDADLKSSARVLYWAATGQKPYLGCPRPVVAQNLQLSNWVFRQLDPKSPKPSMDEWKKAMAAPAASATPEPPKSAAAPSAKPVLADQKSQPKTTAPVTSAPPKSAVTASPKSAPDSKSEQSAQKSRKGLWWVIGLVLVGVAGGISVMSQKNDGGSSSAALSTSSSAVVDPKSGTFVDARDDQKYGWIQVDSLFWMTQNMRWKASDLSCMRGDQCQTVGHLYTHDEAIKACPQGWSIPGLDQWNVLGSSSKNPRWRSLYGKDWGADSMGFGLSATGYVYGGAVYGQKDTAVFWTKDSGPEAGMFVDLLFERGLDTPKVDQSTKDLRFAVRCMRMDRPK